MTDQDILKAMFDRTGVEYTEEDGNWIEVKNASEIVATFLFKQDGSLYEVGAYDENA